MNLRNRAILPSDIPGCLDLCPARSGVCVLGRDTVEAVWKKLIRSPAFTSAVLEDLSQPKPRRILGFGCAVFVSSQFLYEELASPKPGINDRILAGFADGGKPVLNLRDIARANSTTGLSQVVLYTNWDRNRINPQEAQEMRHQLMQAHAEIHVGYRFRDLAVECLDEVDHHYTEVTQVFTIRRRFEEFPDDPYRYLAATTAEIVHSIEGSRGNLIFHYREPMMYYRPAEQRLLTAALEGATDEELSDALGISLAAVKKTWTSTYARTRDQLPGLLPVETNRSKRGAQKRHLLLAWLRDNRQELMPLLYPPRFRRHPKR